MTPIRRLLAIVCLSAIPFASLALELRPATLAAFDRYVQLTEKRMDDEIRGASPFLWIDRQSDRERGTLLQRLNHGDVVVERIETLDSGTEIAVRDGLIHHWIGTVLLPGVTIDRAIAFVQQYERYPEHFAPTIRRSRLLAHAGDHFEVAMRTSTTRMLVTVVIDANYLVDYRTVGPWRVWTKSIATHIAEVESAGKPTERARPADQASGYLWRLNNYCAFEQRPEGTYEQCESISLTRDLPFGVDWMIRPLLSSIPRETLAFTLGRVRAATRPPDHLAGPEGPALHRGRSGDVESGWSPGPSGSGGWLGVCTCSASMRHPARLPDSEYVGRRAYFLTICTYQRRRLFADPQVVDLVVSQFLSTAADRNIAISAYCLMPDHLHAVATVESGDGDFREFVRIAKQRTAFAFRKRHNDVLWQPSYFDRTLRDGQDLGPVLGYLIANPVRAGLVSRVNDYAHWGSSAYTRSQLLEFVAREAFGRT